MRNVQLGVVCLLGAALLAGCDSYTMATKKLGPASDIVSASVENLGWQKAFGGGLGSASFTAVVTTYDKDGRKYTDRQQMVADLGTGSLAARVATPGGSWTVVANVGGLTHLSADAGVDRAVVRERMQLVLPTLLHRLRGPYNLLNGSERGRGPVATRISGTDVVRIGVTGDNRNAVAYYFDPATGILKFVSAGADAPGGDGTVTLYEYRSLPNGATFPSVVRVNHIGRNVLLGDSPVFRVEISDVRF